jgi:hypothetical protein
MYQTVFETTTNVLTQRGWRIGSARISLRNLLSPMRALSASALVATTMLVMGGQSAHGQEASASASSEAVPTDPAATAGPGTPGWSPTGVNGESTTNAAEAVTPRARAAWEGVYFAHKKDIVDLTTPGPNGYNTKEWRYWLILRAGGIAEFDAVVYYSYYPGFGTQNHLEVFWDLWGPRQTGTWTDRGGQVSITGVVDEGRVDNGNPARNYHVLLPRQSVSLFFRKWLGNYQGLEVTGVINNVPFPSQEPPTWTFYKISN